LERPAEDTGVSAVLAVPHQLSSIFPAAFQPEQIHQFFIFPHWCQQLSRRTSASPRLEAHQVAMAGQCYPESSGERFLLPPTLRSSEPMGPASALGKGWVKDAASLG